MSTRYSLKKEAKGEMDFYATVLRKSGTYWVALCLENGLVGQGNTKDDAVGKLKEAIESFEEEYKKDSDIYSAPISVKELHEFLTVEGKEPISGEYELRAVYA
jgi:predicted RNase H-like HicB family nuclease